MDKLEGTAAAATAGEAARADRAAQAQPAAPSEGVLEAISLVGTSLAPFFMQDPRTGTAQGSFAAFARLGAEGAVDWPFADEAAVRECVGRVAAGLAPSMPDGLSGDFEADDDLMWEYRRLFVGPAARPAPPFGSVYTDRDGVLFGMSTLALVEWMRAHGVARTGSDKTPADHFGLMLALMSWLAANQPDDVEEYLRLHLFTWSSHFLEELEAAAAHDFYRALARLTRLTLEGIQNTLGIQVKYPEYYR